jgi:two-component system, cell cycle sensor histidine kinase and response regulator CckA
VAAKAPDTYLERIRELETRLEEAEETLTAIRSGMVDAFVGSGPDGDVIYTLQGADEGYRLFVERMAEGAVTLALDGLILFSNDQFARIIGLPPQRVIGSYLQDFVAAEDRAVLTAVLSPSDGRRAELQLKREDGTLIPVYFSGSVLRRGGLDRIALIITDLRERKLNEQIVEAGKLSRAILEQAAVAIFVTDPSGRIIQASQASEQLAGTPVLLRDFDHVFKLRSAQEEGDVTFLAILDRLRQQGKVTGVPAIASRSDGRCLDVLMNATLLAAPHSGILGCVIVMVDITERKRLEKKLFEKQKLESIGLLAGGIAHDFNNLLVGILGNASLAQEIVTEESSAAQPLEAIVKCSQAAAHLTRQMLAYSGKGQFVVEPVDMASVVQQTVRLLQSSIPGRVAMHLEMPRNLPPVEADASQMQQVVMNLILNGAEAIGDQSGVLQVRIGTRSLDRRLIEEELEDAAIEPGKYVFLEVRDSGCGMDETTKARIFDPFFTTKFTGRGLGLAAVAGIVRGHNGAIQVTSTPGDGSRFVVYFPASGEVERAAPVTPRRTVQIQRGAGTVLVVDDEDVVQQTAKLALERRGYEVLLATSGKAAIELLKAQPGRVSLVLLDSTMPGMSGQDTLEELLEIAPGLQVLVSSGYPEAEVMELFRGKQVSGFVQKPYTPVMLANKVKACLSAANRGVPTTP